MNELIMFVGIVFIAIGMIVVLYGYSIPGINTDYKQTTEEEMIKQKLNDLGYDPMPAPVSNASSIDEIADSIDTKDKVIEEVIPE